MSSDKLSVVLSDMNNPETVIRQITFLRMCGMNDPDIASETGSSQGSVYGYRKYGHRPIDSVAVGIRKTVRERLKMLKEEVRKPKKNMHSLPVLKSLIEYGENSLE